jgi:type I restriction enzyme S subunit
VSTSSFKTETAGEMGKFVGGSGFPTRFQGGSAGAIPFFKVSDMNTPGNELFLTKSNNYIDEFTRKSIGAVLIPAGAIVFAKVGAAVFLERKRILSQDSCIDNNMAAFIVDPFKYEIRFLHYLMSNFKLSSLAATGALPSLNGRQLSSIQFQVPSTISEQRSISEILAQADNLITELNRLILKKEAIKQGVMQQLLTGKTRLQGFESAWFSAQLDELATIDKGVQLGKSEMLWDGQIEVWNGGVTPSGFTDKSNTTAGVVTVSEGGSAGWVGRPRDDFWLGGHCYAVRPRHSSLDNNFLYQYLKFRQSEIMKLKVGSGLPNIQKKDLGKITLFVPKDSSESKAIGSILGDFDSELEVLRAFVESNKRVKQGLMQELLGGRTRLKTEGV